MNEKEINIAQILRFNPSYKMLYSPICGGLELSQITNDGTILCMKPGSSSSPQTISFDAYGKVINYGDWEFADGECVLFPSKDVRDWDVFTWREGDVLESKDERDIVVFDSFSRSNKSRLSAHFIIENFKDENRGYFRRVEELETKNFFNRFNSTFRREVLRRIEERFNVPINRYSYKLFPKFDKGDFVVMEISYVDSLDVPKYVCIFNHYDIQSSRFFCYASLNTGESDTPDIDVSHNLHDSDSRVKFISLRLANGDEKAILVNALHASGKRWDNVEKRIVCTEECDVTKQIVPPVHKFRPFDKVLVRSNDTDEWRPAFFSFIDENDPSEPYGVMACEISFYKQCIPYNDKTAYLVGTSNPYKEEE